MAYENAKTERNEAIAEVDEAIDFLRYYSSELERNEDTPPTHMSQHLASAASATSSRTASSALWPRSIFRSRSPSE